MSPTIEFSVSDYAPLVECTPSQKSRNPRHLDLEAASTLFLLLTAIGEFRFYIGSNRASLINYGERYRSGERISLRLRRGDRQRGRQQALRQEAADAMEPEGRALVAANPDTDPRRLAPVDV